jgi:uncharacterized protein
VRWRDLLPAAVVAVATACGCTDSTQQPAPVDGRPAAAADAPLAPPPDAADVQPADAGDVQPADAGEADAAPPPDATLKPTVILMPAGRPEARVHVALARTEEEKRRGLMYVQHLPVDDGMLFIWDHEEQRSFWMRNTLISLDMIFIRADLTVLGIVENAVPMTDTPRGVEGGSQYVLEVNGGWSAAHGITRDTPLRFEGFTP